MKISKMSNNNNSNEKATRDDLVHIHMLPEIANYVYCFLTSAREYAATKDAANRLDVVLLRIKKGLDDYEGLNSDDDY